MATHKSIAALVIGALVYVTAFSEPALAMSVAEKRGEHVRAAMMKMEVGRDTRVSVKLRNDSTVVGYLAAVSDHSFLVTDPETHVSTQVPFRNVKQISAMSKSAEIAITAVVATAIILVSIDCAWVHPVLCGHIFGK
jgi:small nuclear ribonucleoprotein (snRNP)-like protein